MVICGPVALTHDRPDTVTNPCVILEVLSDATRDYDRGEKFTLYQAIPTLQEYLLIEQDHVYLEHWRRQPTGLGRRKPIQPLTLSLSFRPSV